jgi:hypothetical protein
MAWDLNGLIHPDMMIHVERVGQDKDFFHIVTKNRRRVSIPRVSFETTDTVMLQRLFTQVNKSIYIQSLHNVVLLREN